MTDHDDQLQPSTSDTYQLIESVRELIAMMGTGGISELDLTAGDMSIRLRSASAASPHVVVTAPQVVNTAAPAAATPDPDVPAGHVVSSPMIGTFYSAPGPGEPAFVNVGDEVESGQVIGIIEAMKIMNEITADRSGVVSELLVENAQPVEYGSPLLRMTLPGTLE